ncbi:hypothetical protein O181_101600 [Austropuccinia psidii MF-1]|uniref:Secreted protein n=1 Tax=Austropuccinia psidii MF-1 TaxID=1389203 RepID=A0A9Q3JES1_9BASI|nr:hypothetical protein [Austropuccinia psidii MF-1]
MYSGMPPYSWRVFLLLFAHKSLHLSRIPTLHTQILTPNQDPDASHVKPCAGAASQKCQQFLMLVQAPNTSHTNPYACTGSQIFKLHTGGSLLTIPTLPYTGAGFQCFIHKSLLLYRFLKIQRIPYSSAGFHHFTHKYLLFYRFPMLHTHILTLVQAPDNSDSSLC